MWEWEKLGEGEKVWLKDGVAVVLALGLQVGVWEAVTVRVAQEAHRRQVHGWLR